MVDAPSDKGIKDFQKKPPGVAGASINAGPPFPLVEDRMVELLFDGGAEAGAYPVRRGSRRAGRLCREQLSVPGLRRDGAGFSRFLVSTWRTVLLLLYMVGQNFYLQQLGSGFVAHISMLYDLNVRAVGRRIPAAPRAPIALILVGGSLHPLFDRFAGTDMPKSRSDQTKNNNAYSRQNNRRIPAAINNDDGADHQTEDAQNPVKSVNNYDRPSNIRVQQLSFFLKNYPSLNSPA
jgi:hypothetical protein